MHVLVMVERSQEHKGVCVRDSGQGRAAGRRLCRLVTVAGRTCHAAESSCLIFRTLRAFWPQL